MAVSKEDLDAIKASVTRVIDKKACALVIQSAEDAIEKLRGEIFGNESGIARLEADIARYRSQIDSMMQQIETHQQVIDIFGGK